MPTFRVFPYELDLSRRAVILDTDVLVAAFHFADVRHKDAKKLLFDILDDQLIVPMSVVVETWTIIASTYDNWSGAIEFLKWLTNPLNAVLIPQHVTSSDDVQEISVLLRIDCIDALLLYLADEMSEQCDLQPPVRIATYNTSNFLRCLLSRDFRISLLDAQSLEIFP